MSGIKGFLTETAIYGLGSVISRLFAFFLIPIYIEVLGKSNYANVILIQLVFTLITFFFALNSGVFYYYYEYKSKQLKLSIFTSWVAYQLACLLLLASAFFFVYPYIHIFFDNSTSETSIDKALFYMVASLLPYIVNNTYFNSCRIRRRPIKATVTIMVEILLLVLLVIMFLKYYNLGIEGVFLAQLISRGIVSIVILISGFGTVLISGTISLKLISRTLSYSWPYFLISSFFWLINSADKFIGTQLLSSHGDVAYLVLAGQITLQIAVLVDVERQAYGTYVMSIRKEESASSTYSAVFSFVIYCGALVSVGIMGIGPLLINLLANEEFYAAMKVIPLFALAATINLMIGQFGLGLNLTKNNIYIAVGVIIGGIIGVVLNYYLLGVFQIAGAGVAQIISFTVSASVIYFFSRKKMKIEYEFRWTLFVMIMLFLSVIGSFSTSFFSGSIIYSNLGISSFTLLILFFYGNRKFNFLQLLRKSGE
ncbi:MAG: lipopolysaccharide biosynthesis protein [Fulvivirga sp.]